MRAEGIALDDDELSYQFREKLNLSAERLELLETAVGDAPTYQRVETEAVRLFGRVHLTRTRQPVVGNPDRNRLHSRGASLQLLHRSLYPHQLLSSVETSVSMKLRPKLHRRKMNHLYLPWLKMVALNTPMVIFWHWRLLFNMSLKTWLVSLMRLNRNRVILNFFRNWKTLQRLSLKLSSQ